MEAFPNGPIFRQGDRDVFRVIEGEIERLQPLYRQG